MICNDLWRRTRSKGKAGEAETLTQVLQRAFEHGVH